MSDTVLNDDSVVEFARELHASFAGHPAYDQLAPHVEALAAAVLGNRPVLNGIKNLLGRLVANPKALAGLVAALGGIPGAAPFTVPIAAILTILGNLGGAPAAGGPTASVTPQVGGS